MIEMTPHRPSDLEEELTSRLRNRDRRGLEYLYDHYSAALYGVILRIVRKEEVAKEVLQDVFVRAWTRFDNYDARKGRLFTWLVNIARNTAIDRMRSREIARERKTGPLENSVSTIERSGPLQQSVDAIGVVELLARLPADQRFVVEHLYLKGYTQAELAEESGIALGTVKTRLRTAMQTLKSILGIRE